MYPELWLHEFARERQREMRQFAVRWARRGIGEEPRTVKKLPTLLRLGNRGREVGRPVPMADRAS
jgi:hypothetical protein